MFICSTACLTAVKISNWSGSQFPTCWNNYGRYTLFSTAFYISLFNILLLRRYSCPTRQLCFSWYCPFYYLQRAWLSTKPMESTIVCECGLGSFLSVICSECFFNLALIVAYQHFCKLWQTKTWKIPIFCRHPSSLKCFFKIVKVKSIIGLSLISGLRLIDSVEQRSHI